MNESKTKYKINYKNNEIENILFKTKNMKNPLLMSQYNPTLNETNYSLNVYIDKENEEKNNEKKYKCLFILIIDQSGSMYDSIGNVKKTLSDLIESLPPESYYQLIGFGSKFKKYDSQPIKNTEENITKSKEIINSLEANLGGTDLSQPLIDILKTSYSEYKNISLSKHIIVLTDGQINLGDDIVELIKLHNNEFKIHLIGMGNDVDKDSIIDISKVGNGSSHFIDDPFSIDLKNKIFEILNYCTQEYINNYSFNLNNKDNIKDKILYELQPIYKTIYSNNIINYCFIIENKEKIEDEINIIFNWENFGKKNKKEYLFKSSDILILPQGDDLSKLIIGLSFKYNIIKDKKEQINFSKKYQVLSKYTTLFSEIEKDNNETSTKDEMKTYEKKYQPKRITFGCEICGREFLSTYALFNHKNTKHYINKNNPKRGRGRPRKYPPHSSYDEQNRYDNFFKSNDKRNMNSEEAKNKFNIDSSFIEEIFNFIYKNKSSDKLYSKPEKFRDELILYNLSINKDIDNNNKEINEKSIEDIIYEYLMKFREKTNEKYFSFMIKFLLLLKEFYFLQKEKETKNNDIKISINELPNYCNSFYGDFLEINDFFEFDEEDKNEIVDILLHFFTWLFKSDYTKEKLSLAS